MPDLGHPARLTIGKDAGLLRLDVVQVPQPHDQPPLVRRSIAATDRDLTEGLIKSGVVLRGHSKRDVATISAWAGEPVAAPDLYQVEIVDQLDKSVQSVIEGGSPEFHFVNVFLVADGKQKEAVEYFAHTIPYVRKQPGYVSNNVLMSTDGRHAVNVGQYESRQDFLAIFRQPDVLAAFGKARRIVCPLLGVLPRSPRLRLHDLIHVTDLPHPSLAEA